MGNSTPCINIVKVPGSRNRRTKCPNNSRPGKKNLYCKICDPYTTKTENRGTGIARLVNVCVNLRKSVHKNGANMPPEEWKEFCDELRGLE